MVDFPSARFGNQNAGCSTLLGVRQLTSSPDARLNHILAALPAADLSRWLLLSLDRLPGNELVMTQILLAKMLGIVHASEFSDVVAKLQTAGLVACSEGNIKVLDRPGLEAMSCECCQAVKKDYERLLPAPITA